MRDTTFSMTNEILFRSRAVLRIYYISVTRVTSLLFLYKYYILSVMIYFILSAPLLTVPYVCFVLTTKGSSQDRLYFDHGRPQTTFVAQRFRRGGDSHVNGDL